MKRSVLLSTVALLMLTALVGCGPGASQTKKLVIVQNAEVRMMDPTLRPTTSDAHIDVNIYDGLVGRDHDMKLIPGLATEWKLIDDTTWQFTLRKNVKFHNGEPFNADTVVAWFERLQTVQDRVQGYQSSIQQLGSVASVQKVDDYTVNFVSKVPDPLLPGRLSSYFLLISPKKYIEDNGDQALFEHGVGTGPYKFVEWVKDDHLLLEANEDYWGGKPAIEQIEFRPVPEPSSRVAALQAGEAQIADAIPPAVISQLTDDPDLDVRSVPEATRTYWMYIDSMKEPVLDNVKVRQAINYAVDKQAIIDKLLLGRAQQTASIVTFQSFGYCDVPEYEYDAEKAKQLLAEAGYGDGFDLKIEYSPGHYLADTEIVQAIGNYLEAIGINIEYVPYEWANFLDVIQQQKSEGLFYVGKTNLAMDADYMFAEFLMEKNFGWTYPLKGEALDLYNQERQQMDDAKRADLACQIQKIYRDEAAVLFLWQQEVVFGASNSLDWQPRADGFFYGVDMKWK